MKRKIMHKRIHALFVSVILLVMLWPVSGCSSTSDTEEPSLTPPAEPRLTAENMEAFFNDYLVTQMEDHHVAGATVSVVKDGEVLFTQGYGYADVDQDIPVDPENTVFILGSLSKIFTWTAVMQLVEQGELNLDADVNTYLDFEIPDTYSQSITLNNLMAHNAGFEDRKFEQMEPASGEVTPMGEWLPDHIPARIHRPGLFSAYANYGATLAGYIIERVSGMSYDDYIEENILLPLGMTHTTSRQPIPAALDATMSQSYSFSDGEYNSEDDLNVIANVAPAGAFRSTALDMARFMIAHLNNGSYGDASILQPDTVQLMHSQSFTHDPQVNGMAHGFWEMDMNGQQIIGHAGSHFIFNSLVMLFPDQNMGVFVATNSLGGMEFVGGENYAVFQKAFVDYFFPQDLPTVTAPSDFDADRFTGSYALTMGRSETTPEKLFGMLMAWDIKADGDELVIPVLDDAHFVQVEPLVFRQVDDDTLLVFHEDSSGNVTEAFLSPYPASALIKNRWFETPTFNLILLGLCLILFLSFLIIKPMAFFIQRRRARSQPVNKLARMAQIVAGLVSFLSLDVCICAFASLLLNPYGLFIGDLPLWTFVSVFSVVVVVLTVGMLVFTVLIWVRRFWGLTGRIYYTLVTLSAFGFVWFMYFWNILGKSF
jgi:CubicO group peptidase (beta-lactamase class C family)